VKFQALLLSFLFNFVIDIHLYIQYCSVTLQPYSTDVCVPISNLPEVIVRTKEMIKEAGIIGKIQSC